MVWRSNPEGLDADTTLRIARSFLVVRMVRGSLLLLFLAIVLVAIELRHWPRGLSVAVALTMLLLIGTLVASYRRYVRAARNPDRGPAR